MIATNELLSIAFALIANFTNAVRVPTGAPTSLNDLQKISIGAPPLFSTVQATLVDKHGYEFRIRFGVVDLFCSSNSLYLHHELSSRLSGTSILTSNQVVELARRAVERVARAGNPIAGIAPVAHRQHDSADHDLPFYWIGWPRRDQKQLAPYSAAVEVNASSGEITYLNLQDKDFFDKAFDADLTKRVYKQDTPPLPVGVVSSPNYETPPPGPPLPHPSTNQVLSGIENWLWLCDRLGIKPGDQTNLDSVDWSRTVIYNYLPFGPGAQACQVWFKNGALFDVYADGIVDYFPNDVCFYPWPKEVDRKPFYGRINKDWKQLAKDLSAAFTERVGVPKALMESLDGFPRYRPPDIGSVTVKRIIMDWRSGWKKGEYTDISDTRLVFSVEVDLETGDLKWITVLNPEFAKALAQARAASKKVQ